MLYNKIRNKNPIFYFGHRGAPNLYRENSIESIKQAIHLGCDGVELDVQITNDNQIIIFHDDFITLDGKKYMINLLSYLQLIELCNRNNHPAPDLLINLIPIIIHHSNIVFNIEIKSNQLNNYKILSSLLKHLPQDILINQCIISSFNFLLLYQLRFLFFYNGPLAIILADTNFTNKFCIQLYKMIISILNPAFIHIDIHCVTKSIVDWIHSQSRTINVYTVNNSDELEKCIQMGIDGIFTDNHNFYA